VLLEVLVLPQEVMVEMVLSILVRLLQSDLQDYTLRQSLAEVAVEEAAMIHSLALPVHHSLMEELEVYPEPEIAVEEVALVDTA
jgi:hypothetical protein